MKTVLKKECLIVSVSQAPTLSAFLLIGFIQRAVMWFPESL